MIFHWNDLQHTDWLVNIGVNPAENQPNNDRKCHRMNKYNSSKSEILQKLSRLEPGYELVANRNKSFTLKGKMCTRTVYYGASVILACGIVSLFHKRKVPISRMSLG